MNQSAASAIINSARHERSLPIPWFDVVIILALVALNGVLSMSELAIVSSREARLKAMAKGGSSGAQCALDLASDPGRFLSTVQIGITLIGILAGAYSGRQPRRAGRRAHRAPRLRAGDRARRSASRIVIVLTTYASLVIGELVPKQFALRSPEPIAASWRGRCAGCRRRPRRSSGCSTGPAR